MHPALVNGHDLRACRQKDRGGAFFRMRFGFLRQSPAIFSLPSAGKKMEDYRKKNGHDVSLLFLGNHGVFFAADTTEGIDALVTEVMVKLRRIGRDLAGYKRDGI